jgi:sphingosine kinase
MLGGEDHTGEMLRVSEEVRTELKHDPTGCIDVNHHGPQTNPCHIDLEAGLSQEAHDAKWVFKKGTFLAALVCNHQCRTVQCMESQLLAPGARHDDGNLDLLLIHKVGRLQLLRFLILMQFGQHVSLPFVEYTKVLFSSGV